MQRLEVSGAVRPIYGSLGVKRLMMYCCTYVGQQQYDVGLIVEWHMVCHVRYSPSSR